MKGSALGVGLAEMQGFFIVANLIKNIIIFKRFCSSDRIKEA